MKVLIPNRHVAMKFTISFILGIFFNSCSTSPKESGKADNFSSKDSLEVKISSGNTTETTSPTTELETSKALQKKEKDLNYSPEQKIESNPKNKIVQKASEEAFEKLAPVGGDTAQMKRENLPQITPALSFADWDNILQKFVSPEGHVNYKGLIKHITDLNLALTYFSKNMPDEKWSRNEKLAYWVNTYNAFTLKLIVDNYPVKKITDLDGGKTWDVKRIELGGKRYSLNQIENEIIRPKFKEARIHFAINCAAKSCPPLFNQAFVPEKLDDQLESRTRSFIQNETFNQISKEKLVLSRIFDWYAADFGDLKRFLEKYSDQKISNALISFNEYNWALNE